MSKPYESYRWLYLQYKVKRLTEQEIAELAGVNQSTINRWLEKHGLRRKNWD